MRLEKLERIAALGLDPWGQRFDGHQAIAARAAPCRCPTRPSSEPARPDGPRRRADHAPPRPGEGHLPRAPRLDRTTSRSSSARSRSATLGWSLVELLDLGDLIGVDGRLGYTKTGELTVFAETLTFLAKSLLPPPEKWHGLTDLEQRYRQRYVDLFSNPESLAVFLGRSKLIASFRKTMAEQGFVEVETPTMQSIAGGAAARPFVTHHNALDIDLFLRIAPELYLKRLLVGGMERVFEIGRVYRNEGLSPRHNPEFTMIEAYQAYGDYHVDDGPDRVPDLRRDRGARAADSCVPGARRRSISRLRGRAGPMPSCWPSTPASTRPISRRSRPRPRPPGIATAGKDPDVVTSELFEAVVEDHLNGPIFVIDYPAAICPLTKRKASNPAVAERFELYVHGIELANAYTELNDPLLQEELFRKQLAGLPAEESMAKMDDDFVRALKHAMPPAGGLGIGIDRLCMILLEPAEHSRRDPVSAHAAAGGRRRL